MAKPFAWSFSALNAFETCPRQYQELRLLKRWPQEETEALRYGKLVHSYLEDRFKQGKDLPVFLTHLEPIVHKLETSKGPVQAEYKLTLNAQFQPVDWFAKDAWVRAVGDVIKVHEDKALALDWKTGRFREGDDQLKLQSAVMFASYPHVKEITVFYAWVKDKRSTVRNFKRDDTPAIWGEFLPRVKRMELAKENDDYPPKPSGLCRKHCPVKTCEFHGKGAY